MNQNFSSMVIGGDCHCGEYAAADDGESGRYAKYDSGRK